MSQDQQQTPSRTGPQTLSLADDPELLGDFILESREHLNSIEQNVLKLEQDAGNSEAIHASFRAFHTIKGLAGFLELGAVQEVAHEVETVLDLARNGKLAIDSGVIDRMLESKDYLILWLDQLDSILRAGVPGAGAPRQGAPVVAPDNARLLASIRALTAPQAPRADGPATVAEDASLAKLVEAVAAAGETAGAVSPEKAVAAPVPQAPASQAMEAHAAPAVPRQCATAATSEPVLRAAPVVSSPVTPACVTEAAHGADHSATPALTAPLEPAAISPATPATIPEAAPAAPASPVAPVAVSAQAASVVSSDVPAAATRQAAPAVPASPVAPVAVSAPAASAVSPDVPAVARPAAPATAPARAPAPDEPAAAQNSLETRGREARAVKVDTSKLDYLVDMVGEMVIAQSLVRHDPDLAGETRPRLVRNLSQLARITDEVQRTAMAMRMVPVGQLFQKMSRLVRDLSRKSGKRVELETSGEDTELDRNIVEELADPLMHMVRNSLDHGVETPAEREATGKPPVARVTLRASHQAGHIVIEVGDDGRGLNKDKILKKAIERHLVEPGAAISEHDLFHMIFQPGFSTAAQVTDVSGRGVGMDVVRRQIHKLRGRIDIRSTAGTGTTFLLKVPLTLAIIDGLVVTVGAERYIVPIFAVREMVRPTSDMISTVQGRAEMALVRGSLLPMIRLYRRFAVRPTSEDPTHCLLIVSEGAAGRKFCLMVDGLVGKQEVVIKGMSEMLQGIEGVAGGAILGDGRVGLILDLEALCGEARTDKARG